MIEIRCNACGRVLSVEDRDSPGLECLTINECHCPDCQKPRLIDANALIRSIKECYCKPCKEQGNDYHGIKCRACGYGDAIDDIEDAPTYVKEDPDEHNTID